MKERCGTRCAMVVGLVALQGCLPEPEWGQKGSPASSGQAVYNLESTAPLGPAYTLQLGEVRTFTSFNVHDKSVTGGGGIPIPDHIVADSFASTASTHVTATPETNGIAQAFVGLRFAIDIEGYKWEEIKDLPVEMEINYSYYLDADCGGWGSADAEIALYPFLTDGHWFDSVFFVSAGHDTSGYHAPTGATHFLPLGALEGITATTAEQSVVFQVYSHAHLAKNDDGIGHNTATADVNISEITVSAGCVPKAVVEPSAMVLTAPPPPGLSLAFDFVAVRNQGCGELNLEALTLHDVSAGAIQLVPTPRQLPREYQAFKRWFESETKAKYCGAAMRLAAGEGCVMGVVYQPKKKMDVSFAQLRVRSSDPRRPVQSVPISGRTCDQPEVECEYAYGPDLRKTCEILDKIFGTSTLPPFCPGPLFPNR